MNSLRCLAGSLSRSLGSQDLREEEDEDMNGTPIKTRDQPHQN
jgi:hypothetical protein